MEHEPYAAAPGRHGVPTASPTTSSSTEPSPSSAARSCTPATPITSPCAPSFGGDTPRACLAAARRTAGGGCGRSITVGRPVGGLRSGYHRRPAGWRAAVRVSPLVGQFAAAVGVSPLVGRFWVGERDGRCPKLLPEARSGCATRSPKAAGLQEARSGRSTRSPTIGRPTRSPNTAGLQEARSGRRTRSRSAAGLPRTREEGPAALTPPHRRQCRR